MMKRLFAVLLALAMLMSVSAVFAEGEETAAEPAAETVPVPDTLLVTVFGQEIRENNEKLQSYLANMIEQAGADDEETLHISRMFAMSYVLEEIMLNRKAAEGAPVDEDALRQEALEEWNSIVNSYMQGMGNITDESSEEDKTAARADALSYIESNYGYTEESYIAEVLENTPLNDAYNAIIEELKASRPDLTATEEEILAAYNDTVNEEMEYVGNDAGMYEMYQNYYNYTFHYIPEGYRGVTHILLKVDQELLDNWTDLSARLEESREETESTGESGEPAETEQPAETEEPVTEEMVEAARQAILDSQKETLDAIKAKLENGVSFEDLIAEYGTDPGMQTESNLKNGYPIHADSIIYDANFTKAAAALEKVGDVSDPVISSFGIHILHYLRDIPAGAIEITEEQKEQLKADIESERISLAFSEYYDQWLASSDVVWTEEGEAWKFDQEAYNAYLNPAEDEAPEEEPEAEAVPAD